MNVSLKISPTIYLQNSFIFISLEALRSGLKLNIFFFGSREWEKNKRQDSREIKKKRTILISQEQVFLLLAFYCLYGYSGGLKKICLRLGKRIFSGDRLETRFFVFVFPFWRCLCTFFNSSLKFGVHYHLFQVKCV
jgi:hypothetical protein